MRHLAKCVIWAVLLNIFAGLLGVQLSVPVIILAGLMSLTEIVLNYLLLDKG